MAISALRTRHIRLKTLSETTPLAPKHRHLTVVEYPLTERTDEYLYKLIHVDASAIWIVHALLSACRCPSEPGCCDVGGE